MNECMKDEGMPERPRLKPGRAGEGRALPITRQNAQVS